MTTAAEVNAFVKERLAAEASLVAVEAANWRVLRLKDVGRRLWFGTER